MRGLWDEFEERPTPEARFARALDRLQPMLANIQADGGTWREHGITADQVLAKVVSDRGRLAGAGPVRAGPHRAGGPRRNPEPSPPGQWVA